ncbi:MAG TPA: PQQ-dependent sugar dehydrogenase [Solirubrobacterales bacterium]
MIRAAGIVAALLALLGASSAQALTLERVGGSFDQPIYVTSDPGNANRLFVVEREGTIELVENGVTSEFADLSSVVSCCTGERGLLSVALDPNFDTTGRLYVDYTGEEVPGEIHVDELVAKPDHKSAELSSLRSLLTIPHPIESNHNGGQLQFGPDGNIYISTGDGGGGNDQFHNAQNLNSLLGKILRIRPNPGGPAPFYTVPAGNPFPAAAAPFNTIWNYGLRNPYRFSFDSLNGNTVIGDVGQDEREEVDFAPATLPGVAGGAGANYGWNCREGFIAGPATDPQCATLPLSSFVEPVFDYLHTPDPDLGGERCAITGGYVVRDPALGALYGHYVYADYCAGVIRSLQLPSGAKGRASDDCSLNLRVDNPVSFGEDAARRIYVVEQGGDVFRLSGSPPATCPTPPTPLPQPEARPPLKATFVGIKPERRRVERGRRALLTVFVSPCNDRRGESVTLLRNGHSSGSRFLSRACTARFVPQIHTGTNFAAITHEARGYEAGKSRRLTIRIAHRKRHR